MRSLRIIGGLDPAFGGPSVSSINAAIAAQRAGIETTVAFPVDAAAGDIAPLQERLSREGIRSVEFPLLQWPGGMARRFGICSGLRGWLRHARHGFDVVHCHGAWVLPTVYVCFDAGRGPVTALTPHESLTDFDIARSRNRATRLAKSQLRPRYLRRFDLLVFASALEARDSLPAAERIPAATTVIPHPVYDERSRRPQPRRPAAPGAFRIGFIGRLHAKKNVDLLVRALMHLPEEATLVVAGDGPEREDLRDLAAQCGLGRRIEWLGFVQGEAKAAFFRRIDILAMPSEYECFGVAAAEAMAEGLPVLVSPRTGIAEVIGAHGGGLVVAPAADALAAALHPLIRSPDSLRHHSVRAAEAAARAFSFAAHGAALRRAYETLRGRTAHSHASAVGDGAIPPFPR